ncbi:hypothetical protein AGMMS50239_20680 [Bacteroidia bacterium]|nr:hypothetical protein AGMMS50239_20680 [Bacteroidia bacterium]
MYVESPRIIFVGGSNLSFGLNSQMILDSLHLNPINMAIHANVGLKYIMDNTIQYIKKGDIVVLVPEYIHFSREFDYVSDELLRTVVDVNESNYKLLSSKQLFDFLPLIPQFSLSKLKPTEYFNIKDEDEGIYDIHSFNQYGDAYRHWGLEKRKFSPELLKGSDFNPEVIQGMKKFQSAVSSKGATLFVSYPCFQDIAFSESTKAIKEIETQYIKNGFAILGTPERYMIPDSLTFNTSYHLSKKGMDYRTNLLIEDLEAVINP